MLPQYRPRQLRDFATMPPSSMAGLKFNKQLALAGLTGHCRRTICSHRLERLPGERNVAPFDRLAKRKACPFQPLAIHRSCSLVAMAGKIGPCIASQYNTREKAQKRCQEDGETSTRKKRQSDGKKINHDVWELMVYLREIMVLSTDIA